MRKMLFSVLILCVLACNSANRNKAESEGNAINVASETTATSEVNNAINNDQVYFQEEIEALYKKCFVYPINNAIPALYPEQFDQLMKQMNHKKIMAWQGEIETLHLDKDKNIEMKILCWEKSFENPAQKNISLRLIVGDSYEDESASAKNADMSTGLYFDHKLYDKVFEANKIKHKRSNDTKYVLKKSKTKVNSQNEYYSYLFNLAIGTRIKVWATVDDYTDRLHDVIPQSFGKKYTVQDIKLFISIDSVNALY